MLRLPDNTTRIHALVKSLPFPVFIYSTNTWEETQISYLYRNYFKKNFTTYTICKWCKSHNISYQVLFPHSKLQLIKLIKNPSYAIFILSKKKFSIKNNSIARSQTNSLIEYSFFY